MAARDHFRALDRRPVSLQATLTSDSEGWERPGRVVDLGLGGACVELVGEVEQDTSLRLTVVAPNLWDPLVLNARVAWTGKREGLHRLGLRFDHDSGVTLRALVELLAEEGYE